MKKWLLVMSVLVVGVATASNAADPGLGVGVMVGEPTGVSIKKWISARDAIDVGIGWSFSENDSVQFHVDYLVHNDQILRTPDFEGRFPLYAGIGARVKLKDENDGHGRNNDDALVGIRIPLGISYIFAHTPMDVFLEIVPVLDVAPDTDFDMNAAVGVRYYFR